MKSFMVTKNEAYVDTSALIAFLDRDDLHHELFKRLFSSPPTLVTTSLVIAEGHAWFLRRHNRHLALRFLQAIESMPKLQIQQIGLAEQKAAFRLLRKFADQDLTLADAVGLHVMKARRIGLCWSTDFHLGLTGVTLAIHQ
jgi:predicted nucleic acid-binding protein